MYAYWFPFTSAMVGAFLWVDRRLRRLSAGSWDLLSFKASFGAGILGAILGGFLVGLLLFPMTMLFSALQLGALVAPGSLIMTSLAMAGGTSLLYDFFYSEKKRFSWSWEGFRVAAMGAFFAQGILVVTLFFAPMGSSTTSAYLESQLQLAGVCLVFSVGLALFHFRGYLKRG